MGRLEWTFLGRVDYPRALQLQARQVERVAAGGPARLLLLEHPPTITLGRSASEQNVLMTQRELSSRGIGLHRVPRGGDVTYHGPGQLVGYPIAHLGAVGCSVPAWVAGHAEALVAYLGSLGVRARWSAERPGVWAAGKKIAAVGFHLSRRISSHGFALNLDPDLSHYQAIVPCGLHDYGVTSLAELGVDCPTLASAARAVAERIADQFGLEPVSPAGRPGTIEEAAGVPAEEQV